MNYLRWERKGTSRLVIMRKQRLTLTSDSGKNNSTKNRGFTKPSILKQDKGESDVLRVDKMLHKHCESRLRVLEPLVLAVPERARVSSI